MAWYETGSKTHTEIDNQEVAGGEGAQGTFPPNLPPLYDMNLVYFFVNNKLR